MPVSKLNAWIERFCLTHPRFGIPNLIYYIVGGKVLVYLLDMISYSGVAVSELLEFDRTLILQGQVWRLFSFLFTAWGGNVILFAFSMYFLWFIGTSLEREWGTAKFTCYYGLGAVLALIVGLIGGSASTGYLGMSLFLAYATLYPDTQFLVFFVIPVKAKWLAWIDGGLMALGFLSNLVAYNWVGAGLIVAAILNYLIFFWDELMYHAKRLRGQTKHSQRSNVIRFKKAARDFKRQDYTHKCDVCGRTDTEFPDLEFRYCSKCAGYHCYCIDHINNHEHITE